MKIIKWLLYLFLIFPAALAYSLYLTLKFQYRIHKLRKTSASLHKTMAEEFGTDNRAVVKAQVITTKSGNLSWYVSPSPKDLERARQRKKANKIGCHCDGNCKVCKDLTETGGCTRYQLEPTN